MRYDRLSHTTWQRTRPNRIDTLTRYLPYAAYMARLENNPNGWWSRHVAWTLRRLEACGYTFPDVDTTPLPARNQGRIAA